MLKVEGIFKDYEDKPLLNGVNLEVEQGEIVCLLGSSGSGKSTLLRIIAGLEKPEAGTVSWNSEDYTPKPAHQRGFGLMFQDYALFPHRSVAENIAFGLRVKKLPSEQVNRRVAEMLETIQMGSFAKRPVTELSGGEQQRVALARALAPDPNLLMLDEPLGALDHSLRAELLNELRQVLRESRKPAIYVTHDREEAFAIADRLLILHEGVILQQGSPEALFNQPVNAWVATFLGLGNLIPAQVSAFSPLQLQTDLGTLCGKSCLGHTPNKEDLAVLLLRPEDALIGEASLGMPNHLKARVVDSVFMGHFYLLAVEINGQLLEVHSPKGCAHSEQVDVAWPEESVLCLKE